MKKCLLIRVLTALGGVTLLAAAACAAAEGFFGAPVTAALGILLSSGHVLAVLVKLLLVLGLLVLAGAAVLCALPRKPREQDGFIMQRGENGAIGISVKAIEKQVRSCIAQHELIADAEVSIRECRDGLIILLNVDQVAGVNIPLSVGVMQKQIKQYVAGCTGVDVHEVRVMVENNTANVVASPFAVQEAEFMRARPAEEPAVAEAVHAAAEEAPAQAAPVQEAPAAPVVLPEIPPMPVMAAEAPEEDDRPLHQRLFGTEEQPVFVPAPPEMIAEPEQDMEEAETPAEGAEAAEEAAEEAELPMDAAQAGAAYSEALWADEAQPESAEDNTDDAEEEQPLA